MKNAHLRFGTMRFHKAAGNSMSRFSIHMDRFIGERTDGAVAKAHFISLVGGDAQIAAASAIVSDQQNFDVEGPGVPVMHVTLGKDAQCYRASIQLSAGKRPLRHLVAVSEEFDAISRSDTNGRTLLAESGPEFVWASMAQIFGLPAVPEWAGWFYKKLNDNLAIRPIHGLGFRPVEITGTKQEFLRWLSEGIRKGEIQLPESDGPAVWPAISMERMLSLADEIPDETNLEVQ
jgi:hypothetical protein